MSNYIKTVNFAIKDTYASGDARKIVRGTELDTEFNNISTAVATKQDLSGKGVANGYAPLDSGALLPVGNVPSLPTSIITTGTFVVARIATGTPNVTSPYNYVRGDGSWAQVSYLDLVGTQTASQIPALDVSKITTGTFASSFIPALDASKITTGTFPAARIPLIGTLSGITIQADPGGTPTGVFGDIWFYY